MSVPNTRIFYLVRVMYRAHILHR